MWPSRWMITLLLAFTVGCNRPTDPVLPHPSEIQFVTLLLYDDNGVNEVSHCVIKDKPTIQAIYERLTPFERNSSEADMMRSGPIAGCLGFRGPYATTWVEYVDSGRNPLCFRIGETSCLRGGQNYQGYREDHKKFYGIDSTHMAEELAFHRFLQDLCFKATDVESLIEWVSPKWLP